MSKATGMRPANHANVRSIVSRRQFMKGGAAGLAFTAFAQRAGAFVNFDEDYGALRVATDRSTGLPLLRLPKDFQYASFGWTGQIMHDGIPTPGAHDGMAVVTSLNNRLRMIRNHELSGVSSAVPSPATYDPVAPGGCSVVSFNQRTGRWLESRMAIGGTVRNCAGGATPWGSWITCEETLDDYSDDGGKSHGWVFEVPAMRTPSGEPIREMGRFSHEAVAVDPSTGFVYETEDATPSCFYKFEPDGPYSDLTHGGRLYALKVVGVDHFVFDTPASFENGTSWDVEWVLIDDPQAKTESTAAQGIARGAASFSRGEGAFYDSGYIYFTSTDGGGVSEGQVYQYDPRRERLTLIFESRDAAMLDNPDNIAVSPRGGIILCEDGDGDQRLVGLSLQGQVFDFALNDIRLSAEDLAIVDRIFPGVAAAIPPDDYSGSEWAGATFVGRWLFVNIQTPGITFAITGPWEKGIL